MVSKYVIWGVAHCGTCSLERYLVEQGAEVIRLEDAFRAYDIDHYKQNYMDYKPIMITSETKSKRYNFEKILKTWQDLFGSIGKRMHVFSLQDLAELPDFPWENRQNCLSAKGIRPKYEMGKEPVYEK